MGSNPTLAAFRVPPRPGFGDDEPVSTHVLKPRPPVRAFLIGDVVALGGVVLAVLGHARSWPTAVLVLLWLVAALGALLVVLAAVSMVANRVVVDVDAEGYRLKGPGLDKAGTWSEVTRVTQNPDGTRLTLHHGQVARTHLLVPGGASTPQMQALIADVAAQLDADRGYRSL